MDAQAAEHPFVSTGRLPPAAEVQRLVQNAHDRFKSNEDGQNSQVYPALARVPSELFGVCIVGTSGTVYAAGDTDHEFSIMSVSKPFLFALICEQIGAEKAREKLGANATGFAFNSIASNPVTRSPMIIFARLKLRVPASITSTSKPSPPSAFSKV